MVEAPAVQRFVVLALWTAEAFAHELLELVESARKDLGFRGSPEDRVHTSTRERMSIGGGASAGAVIGVISPRRVAASGQDDA